MSSQKEERKSVNISNPLMRLLKGDKLVGGKTEDKLEKTLTKSLVNASVINQFINAWGKFLSLFILFPMQLVIFYLFINDRIIEGLIFTVSYAFLVLLVLYKILKKLNSE
jgi:hypothetical protein